MIEPTEAELIDGKGERIDRMDEGIPHLQTSTTVVTLIDDRWTRWRIVELNLAETFEVEGSSLVSNVPPVAPTASASTEEAKGSQ